jgi:hypothetical protein
VRGRLVDRPFAGIVEAGKASVVELCYSGLSAEEPEIIDAFKDGLYVRRVVRVEGVDATMSPACAYVVRDREAQLVQRDHEWQLDQFIADFGEEDVRCCAVLRRAYGAGRRQ